MNSKVATHSVQSQVEHEDRKLFTFTLIAEVSITIVFLMLTMYRYSNGRPCIAPILTIIGWCFSFLMIFLIPLDLHYSFTNAKTSSSEKSTWLALSYTNSALNYLVYPYLIAYIASASFTRVGRLCNAIRKQLVFYCLYVIVGIGVGCLIYFSEPVRT